VKRELVRVDSQPYPPGPPAPPARPPRRPLDYAEPAAYVLFGAVLLAVLLGTDWGQVAPDTRPELYLAPARTLLGALSSWRPDPYLGQPNFDTGTAPVALLVLALRALGADAWLAVRLWRALLLGVAAWGAVRLFHEVAGGGDAATGRRSNPAGRVAAAVLYVANPYVVVAGATNPVLLPYALAPWLLLALARAVREPRSWRWPAAFALAFFVSGGSNAGVVSLFMLLGVPCYLVYAVIALGRGWRELARPALRCLGLAALVSLYWLVPAVLAARSGASIAFDTEQPGDVGSVSSYAETLRLLGLWTLYGRAGDRLFLPNFAAYLTNPLVVLASFALPVAAVLGALVSRARARALGAILLAVAVPVMVGLFPTDNPSPFGRLLNRAFAAVPGAIAFRTTNKAGALAALGITLLVAVGVAEVAGRRGGWRPTASRQSSLIAAIVALGVVAVAVLPAWTGGLNLERFRVPAYWRQAAADLNAGPSTSRVLLLPGQVQADYTWGCAARTTCPPRCSTGPRCCARPCRTARPSSPTSWRRWTCRSPPARRTSAASRRWPAISAPARSCSATTSSGRRPAAPRLRRWPPRWPATPACTATPATAGRAREWSTPRPAPARCRRCNAMPSATPRRSCAPSRPAARC